MLLVRALSSAHVHGDSARENDYAYMYDELEEKKKLDEENSEQPLRIKNNVTKELKKAVNDKADFSR